MSFNPNRSYLTLPQNIVADQEASPASPQTEAEAASNANEAPVAHNPDEAEQGAE